MINWSMVWIQLVDDDHSRWIFSKLVHFNLYDRSIFFFFFVFFGFETIGLLCFSKYTKWWVKYSQRCILGDTFNNLESSIKFWNFNSTHFHCSEIVPKPGRATEHIPSKYNYIFEYLPLEVYLVQKQRNWKAKRK